MNVRQVPEAALRDPDAVELARVWVAEEGLHCSLKIGMYHESTDGDERRAWGTILADMTRHIANALRDRPHPRRVYRRVGDANLGHQGRLRLGPALSGAGNPA